MITKIISVCLLLDFLFSLASCKKEGDEASPKNLKGIWVEQQTRLDTLKFLGGPYFDLQRGKELYNGHLLPKFGAGRYDYQIRGDSISLWYTFSNNTHRHQYYFSPNTETITIGNFYNNQALPQTLTFVRLK